MIKIRYKANGEVRALPKPNADFLVNTGVAEYATEEKKETAPKKPTAKKTTTKSKK